jgi:glucose dehydrogenase
MSKQWIAANPAPGSRVISGQFLHSGGQQMILIGFCLLRTILRRRNVSPVKKMAEKAFLVAIVVFVRGGTSTRDFAQQ